MQTRAASAERDYTLEEMIAALGLNLADFRLGGAEACEEGEHASPVPSPGDGFVHYVRRKCGQSLLAEPLREAAERRAPPQTRRVAFQ